MKFRLASIATIAMAFGVTTAAHAQLGRQQGLLEPNVAADSALKAISLSDPAIAALKAARPILSVVALDSILGAQSLTKPQRADLYKKMFVHVDINRGADAEFMLIPGMDAKKLATIKAGRPWKSFDALGAALSSTEQYLFIPIDLNTWTDPIMDSFASIGVGTRQWKREFAEYRPWTSMEQFEREIGKYLRAKPTELKRLERYVIINK
ncbi:MAG: hypothetical protein ABI852_21745 [Gemmatimonadaceae bacterium]